MNADSAREVRDDGQLPEVNRCRCGRTAHIYSGATDANYCSAECAEVARLEARIAEVERQTGEVGRPEIEE